MNIIHRLSLAVVGCVVLLLLTNCSDSSAEEKYRGTVIKIIDGDSLVVRRGSEKVTIRLYGIDSPEWDQPFASLAKDYLNRATLSKNVFVHRLYLDDYGRSIAFLSLQDVNINEELVTRGFAWVHRYYCKMNICSSWRNLEKQARRDKRGLWLEEEPTSPWIWKNRRKK